MAFSDIFQYISVAGLYNDTTGSTALVDTGTTAGGAVVQVGGIDPGTGFAQALHVDASGNLFVNASITPPSDNTATGAITSSQTVVVSTEGTSALMVQISGTWTGTLDFQVSLDGTTWQAVNLYPAIPDGAPAVSSTTANGNFTLPVGGIQQFRVLGNTVATGSATINLTAGQGQYGVFNYSDNAANFLATVTQGPAGASPWLVAGNHTNNATAPNGSNIGALTALANAAAPTNVEGNLVLLSVDLAGNLRTSGTTTVTGTVAVTQSTSPWVVEDTVAENYLESLATTVGIAGSPAVPVLNVNVTGSAGTITVAGTLTNNNAAPTTTNFGSLDYIATATPEAYTQGNQVLATTSLGGAVRVVPVDEANASSLSYYELTNGNVYVAVTTTFTPVIAWETNSAAFIFLLRMVQVFTSGTVVEFVLLKNPTVTGGAFSAVSGHLSANTTATSYTGGTKVLAGYVGATPFMMQNMLDAMAGGAPGDIFALEARS